MDRDGKIGYVLIDVPFAEYVNMDANAVACGALTDDTISQVRSVSYLLLLVTTGRRLTKH